VKRKIFYITEKKNQPVSSGKRTWLILAERKIRKIQTLLTDQTGGRKGGVISRTLKKNLKHLLNRPALRITRVRVEIWGRTSRKKVVEAARENAEGETTRTKMGPRRKITSISRKPCPTNRKVQKFFVGFIDSLGKRENLNRGIPEDEGACC